MHEARGLNTNHRMMVIILIMTTGTSLKAFVYRNQILKKKVYSFFQMQESNPIAHFRIMLHCSQTKPSSRGQVLTSDTFTVFLALNWPRLDGFICERWSVISHFRNEFGNGTSWGPQRQLGLLLGTDLFWSAVFQAYGYQITMSKSDLLLTEKNIPGANLLRPIEEFNCTFLRRWLLCWAAKKQENSLSFDKCVLFTVSYTSFSVVFSDAFWTYKYVFYRPNLLNMFCLFSFTVAHYIKNNFDRIQCLWRCLDTFQCRNGGSLIETLALLRPTELAVYCFHFYNLVLHVLELEFLFSNDSVIRNLSQSVFRIALLRQCFGNSLPRSCCNQCSRSRFRWSFHHCCSLHFFLFWIGWSHLCRIFLFFSLL